MVYKKPGVDVAHNIQFMDLTHQLPEFPSCEGETMELHPDMEKYMMDHVRKEFLGHKMSPKLLVLVQSYLDTLRLRLLEQAHPQACVFITYLYACYVQTNGNHQISIQCARWMHYCADCRFLGFADLDLLGPHDLYYCIQGTLPTVIARYGNEEPEYISGMAIADEHPLLYEARERAIKLNLWRKY